MCNVQVYSTQVRTLYSLQQILMHWPIIDLLHIFEFSVEEKHVAALFVIDYKWSSTRGSNIVMRLI